MISSNNKNKKLSKTIVIGSIIVTLALIGGVYAFIHIKNVRAAQSRSGQVANVKPPATENKTSNQTKVSPNNEPGESSPATPQENAPLVTPSGNFVSNHKPGQNGTSNAMQSTCNTSPGAQCDITFTNAAGIVKKLGAKTADADGAVLWNWNIDGSNLGPGEWTVRAVVTEGDQTSTAVDAIRLEVL